MKKILKRSLVVMVIVLSMIAALCTVVSAEEPPAGTVATLTVNGQTTPYTNFADLIAEVNGAGTKDNAYGNAAGTNASKGTYEITLYADVEQNTAIIVNDTVTFKAAEGLSARPKLTVRITNPRYTTYYRTSCALAVAYNKLEFKGIDIDVKPHELPNDATKGSTSLIMFNTPNGGEPLPAGRKHNIVFDDVNLTSAAAVINEYNTGEFTNCDVTVKNSSITATGDFIKASRSIRAAGYAFKLAVEGNTTFAVANIYSAPLTNNPTGARFITYADDATAKVAGMCFRVGDTTEGQDDVVFFKTKDEAILKGAGDQSIYDITGATPVKVGETCAHTFVETVVAPTCDEQGYTENKCSKCNVSRKDNYVEALGHEYSKATCQVKAKCSKCNKETGELARHKYGVATCTKKAACSVCGVERGELAKHVDLDKNDKCDKCDAKMSVEEVTTTAPATEEKKGCKGTVGVAGLALVAALGSCALFVEKKRK